MASRKRFKSICRDRYTAGGTYQVSSESSIKVSCWTREAILEGEKGCGRRASLERVRMTKRSQIVISA